MNDFGDGWTKGYGFTDGNGAGGDPTHRGNGTYGRVNGDGYGRSSLTPELVPSIYDLRTQIIQILIKL